MDLFIDQNERKSNVACLTIACTQTAEQSFLLGLSCLASTFVLFAKSSARRLVMRVVIHNQFDMSSINLTPANEKEAYENLESEISTICEWAEKNNAIRKVYIYGSRARGDFRHDSDLDVGIEIDPRKGDTNSLTTWTCEAKKWTEELNPMLRYQLHLNWYDKEDTPTVHSKICAGSIIVYEKKNR